MANQPTLHSGEAKRNPAARAHVGEKDTTAPPSFEQTNALVRYVRQLSPKRLSVLTGLFLAAVAALLVIKLNQESEARRLETQLRLVQTVQLGARSMNVDIMTGNPPGEDLGTDLPPGALVSFYHVTRAGEPIASAGRFDAVSLSPQTLGALPLATQSALTLQGPGKPLTIAWQNLDNGEVLVAATPARDMRGRVPLWIGYAVLLGAITLVSASLMRAFIRQNAAAQDAAAALGGYIRMNEALGRGRCCPWYFDRPTRRVLLSRSLLEPLGLGPRDRTFSLQELTSLIHPKDLRMTLGIFTGDKKDSHEGVARLRSAGGGWSQILIRTDYNSDTNNRSGIAFDVSGLQLASAPEEAGMARPLTHLLSSDEDDASDLDKAHSAFSPDSAQGQSAAAGILQDGIDTIPDAFVLWSADHRLMGWNKRFAMLFRFAPDALAPGMAADAALENAQAGKQVLRDYFLPPHATETNDGQTTSETRPKSAREVRLSGDRWVKVTRRQTETGGLVCVATNITDQKRRARAHLKRERQLERTVADLERSRRDLSDISRNYAFEKRRAEDASRSKSEFLANMSHELRTPLNAINGFSEVMQSELYGPLGSGKYREYIDDIHASGRHLLELIDDILDMSRIEAGHLQLEPQRIELDRILQESVRLVSRRADHTGVALNATTANAPPIFADGRATKQVLLNLLSNAVKFSDRDGKVALVTEADLDCVSVMIIDSGPGIERTHLVKLGSPFELGQNQFTGARDGSGLGLALSKSLMELQGGLLALASTPGQGTTACATFPRRDGAPVRLPSFLREEAHLLTRPHTQRDKDREDEKKARSNRSPAQAAE
ncbi:MAG: histidine kinase dimerization/phospho-acceptor domain-containing protein [Pseudomonadota bacterium]